MPTHDEAKRIAEISQHYLGLEDLKDLLVKLEDEVGKPSDSEALRHSLHTLRVTLDEHFPGVHKTKAPFWLQAAFLALVIVHAMLVIGLVFAFFIIPFVTHLAVAIACDTFIWFFCTSQVDCKLTNLENKMRQRMGMKRIGGFVGHYFMRPVKRMLTK